MRENESSICISLTNFQIIEKATIYIIIQNEKKKKINTFENFKQSNSRIWVPALDRKKKNPIKLKYEYKMVLWNGCLFRCYLGVRLFPTPIYLMVPHMLIGAIALLFVWGHCLPFDVIFFLSMGHISCLD